MSNQNQKGRKSNKNKKAAESQINTQAKPQELSNLINSFTQLDRGNALVTLDDEFIERSGQEYCETIASVQRQRHHIHPVNGLPTDHEYLTNGIIGGLSLSIARKLLLATPDSQTARVAPYNNMRNFNVMLPKSFIPITDLVGKVTHGEWNIRMKYNELMIQRFLSKSLRYFAGNQDFLHNHIAPGQGNQHHVNLANLQNHKSEKIIFYDNDSLRYIKDKAREEVKIYLRETVAKNYFDAQGAAINVTISPPQFDPDTAGRQEIINWLNMLHVAEHNINNHFQAMLRCGLTLIMEPFWLAAPAQTLGQLDPGTFPQGNPAHGLTIHNLIQAAGYHHIEEFIAPGNFRLYWEAAFVYYQSTISSRMNHFFDLAPQGISTLGSPAQLVYLEDDDRTLQEVQFPAHVVGVDRRDIRTSVWQAYSFVKLDLIDSVPRSAFIRLVDRVEIGSDWEIGFNSPLRSIRSSSLSKDSVLYSGKKVFQ